MFQIRSTQSTGSGSYYSGAGTSRTGGTIVENAVATETISVSLFEEPKPVRNLKKVAHSLLQSLGIFPRADRRPLLPHVSYALAA